MDHLILIARVEERIWQWRRSAQFIMFPFQAYEKCLCTFFGVGAHPTLIVWQVVQEYRP